MVEYDKKTKSVESIRHFLSKDILICKEKFT